MLIAGVGFDPRSAVVARSLSVASPSAQCLLIKEIRTELKHDQIERAELNKKALFDCFQEPKILDIAIFGDDGAVVGGRNAVMELNNVDFSDLDDVIVDISALSVGTSYPIIRFLSELHCQNTGPKNLHIIVIRDPTLDGKIHPISCDRPGYVHGFKGELTLEESSSKAIMWLPQLAFRRKTTLNLIHQFIAPDDTCPIVPLPSTNPRAADLLFWEYRTEIESGWSVDTRNIVYANDVDPVDLYRTIVKLNELRESIFEEVGGSHLVLSPLGSKIMALGALMAALEQDLPVAYVEAEDYDITSLTPSHDEIDLAMYHVWLEGSVYPEPTTL